MRDFCAVGAVHDHRVEAEDVDVDGARAAHRGTGFGDRLHHDSRFGDAEAGPAIRLGHGDAKPVALGHGVEERVREDRVAIALQPVGFVEPGANAKDLIADLLLRLGKGEVHGRDLSGTVRLPEGYSKRMLRAEIGVT